MDDLISRLGDPALSSLAQTKIFNKIGNDANGNAITTNTFLAYLKSKRPRYYDGVRSTYCYDSLTGTPDWLCFKNAVLHFFFNTSVKDHITSGTDAVTGTPSNPLLTFFRPDAIGFNSLGKNLGNEGLIFHEALHGISGQVDSTILREFGLDPFSHASCSISVRIQNAVLLHSSGLDPTISSPCPTGDN
jgi:hypothetical protein